MGTMIGERIREARLAQDRSLADLAGKLNISVATLSRIENEKQSVDMQLFLAIANVLDIPARQLLRGNGEDEDGPIGPLVRRIASLGAKERQEFWRGLAAERRATRSNKHSSDSAQTVLQVEDLIAQLDFMREELDSLRKRIKKR